MPKNKCLINISDFDLDKAQGINKHVITSLIKSLNQEMGRRRTPLYVFIAPDLEKWAKKIHADSKEVFLSFKFLSSFYKNYVKMKAVLDVTEDQLFYVLEDEDIEELEKENTLHNPDNPNIVYKDARDLVRHAFVVGL